MTEPLHDVPMVTRVAAGVVTSVSSLALIFSATGVAAAQRAQAPEDGTPATVTVVGLHGTELPIQAWRSDSGVLELRDTTHVAAGGGQILTYDGSGTDALIFTDKLPRSLKLVQTKSDTFGRKANKYGALDAHWGAAQVYDYYAALGRNGLDGKGGDIVSVVGVVAEGKPLANAFWNGRYMVYGSGTKKFKPYAASLDVVAHEMTHGVIDTTVDLADNGQPGALHEAFSDYFGNAVENNVLGLDPASSIGGLMGHDLCYQNPGEECAIRNLNRVPTTAQNFQSGSKDRGFVHGNSLLISSALWNLRTQLGAQVADPLVYAVLTERLTARSQFSDVRQATIELAAARGLTAAQQAVVAAAFDARGITPGWEKTVLGVDSTLMRGALGADFDVPDAFGDSWVIADNTPGRSAPPGIYLGTVAGGEAQLLTPVDSTKKLGYSRPKISERRVGWVRATEFGKRARVETYDRATGTISVVARAPKGTKINEIAMSDSVTAWLEVPDRRDQPTVKYVGADGRRRALRLPVGATVTVMDANDASLVLGVTVPRGSTGGELQLIAIDPSTGAKRVMYRTASRRWPTFEALAVTSKFAVLAEDAQQQNNRQGLVRFDLTTGKRKVLIPEEEGPEAPTLTANDEWITWSNVDSADPVLRQMPINGRGGDRVSCSRGEQWQPVAVNGRGVIWIDNTTTNDDLVYRSEPNPSC